MLSSAVAKIVCPLENGRDYHYIPSKNKSTIPRIARIHCEKCNTDDSIFTLIVNSHQSQICNVENRDQ